MALDATPGGASANAYCTVQQATDFLNERLHNGPWYVEPEDVMLLAQREAALITATRLLDEQMQWVGAPATSTQALGWPRTALPLSLTALDTGTVPVTIQRATAYYALALLRDTSESATNVAAGTIKRRSMGETSIEYFQPGTSTQAHRPPSTSLPSEIRQMLRGYGLMVGGMVVPLVRT